MDFYEKELLIARIKSGCLLYDHQDGLIEIRSPNKLSEYKIQLVYKKAYEEAKSLEMFDKNDIMVLLVDNYLWDENKQEIYENSLPKDIENFKVGLFANLLRSTIRNSIKEHLEVAKKELLKLQLIRHTYDYVTCHGFANFARNQYIISNCSFINDKLVDWTKINLNNIISFYYTQFLSQEKIREIAKTNPWRDEWNCLKSNFKVFNNNLTYEQKTLMAWSTMYDNIYESMDCPTEDVIDDDDTLDGWIISQKRKRERDKNKSSIESGLGKAGNADEVFIMTDNSKDAKKIYDMNDAYGSSVYKGRLNQLKNQDSVKEQNFRDSKQKQFMQATQAYKDKVGGTK